MPETVARSRVGAATYLTPAVALDADAPIADLQAAATACIAANNLQLIIDLGAVTLISGKGIETLLAIQSKLAALGGRLKLVNPNALLKDVFVATGVSAQVPVLDPASGETLKAVGVSRNRPKRKLGDCLLERKLIDADRIAEAIRLQAQSGLRMGQIIVDKGWVAESDLLKVLSEQFDMPYVALRAGLWDPAALSMLDQESVRRLQVLPMFRVNDTLTLATSDPQSLTSFDEIRGRTGCKIRLVLARREDIVRAQTDAYSGGGFEPTVDLLDVPPDDLELVSSTLPGDYTVIDQLAEGSPVINLVNSVIQRAIRDKASDIHIEPARGRGRIRFRIDGVLYEVMTPRQELLPAIVSRLKVMANLDIAERRLPQDGRLQVSTQGRTVDLRFSSLPGIYGEKIVLRVLDKNQSILDVEKLGMSASNLQRFKGLLARSHGLILVTGPTGSGKTTTLYAAINQLKSIEKNIVTIEDPVEYQLDVINQNQVNEAIGLSFARLLKHVLRQDPDIVMVGEVRERQTAEIAVQAALTGHLVLSTLHTNDAIGAVSRLVEMGIEPYLLASALIGVVAQRLVRRVCGSCKTTFLAPPEIAAAQRWTGQVRLARGTGCPACYDSGYKGRVPIHELLEVDAALQRLMAGSLSPETLGAHLQAAGHRTLYADGVERVLAGDTTLEEISRVIDGH
ncbi:MAG TPA: ATPase, T2SS/T4P/T4SS family [Burkholderiaceae bacterium]|nr:ATPase, T2SS/T4P/T4SS family [Burkholderiaceae bacterium]